jgi:regulator of protease activity HflC (stomatin/prohibitin superfamily)
MDALLTDRGELGRQALTDVKAKAETYGLDVVSLDIKDVILAPRVRDLLMREAEARREAQATLVAAREEVAAMRALANAARLAEEHPGVLRLRELDTVRRAAQAGGNTIVLGVGATPNVAAASAPSPRRGAPAMPEAEDVEE